jgi:hypothetical protein
LRVRPGAYPRVEHHVGSRNARYHQVSSGIARYREGSKKHLDNPVPNSDFSVLYYLGI